MIEGTLNPVVKNSLNVGTVLIILFILCRPVLPEFHLDFGYVVYGLVVSRTITLSNIGHCPVTFTTAYKALEGTGYSIDLGEKVRALPSLECLDFTVRFDPASVKCTKGKVSTLLPFNVRKCGMLNTRYTRPGSLIYMYMYMYLVLCSWLGVQPIL